MRNYHLAIALMCLLSGTSRSAAANGASRGWTGLAFSRATPTATIAIAQETQFVLHADRDVTAIHINLEPLDNTIVGAWSARLAPLPVTEEPSPPDLDVATRAAPVWSKSGTVSTDSKFETTQRIGVPRSSFKNWALTLTPRGEARAAITLQVRAILVDQVVRANWLMQLRARVNPEGEPEPIRDIVRHLTDQEVGHWAGMASRQIFLRAWRRMTAEEISATFGAEEPHNRWPPHLLPNGAHLLVNGAIPTSYKDVYPADRIATGAKAARSTRAAPSITAQRPASIGSSTAEVRVGVSAPAYRLQFDGADADRLLCIRLSGEARSVAVRLSVVPPVANTPQSVSFECVDGANIGLPAEPRVFQGTAGFAPNDGGRRRPPVFRATIPIGSHDRETFWLLRLRQPPSPDGKAAGTVRVELRIDADVRPITDRERELMAWRETIDPLVQPDLARERYATFSDEEIRYYTGFKDRASFLKHWMRTRRTDLPVNERGLRVISSEVFPLLGKGVPLPNGKYLHHNGNGVPF